MKLAIILISLTSTIIALTCDLKKKSEFARQIT